MSILILYMYILWKTHHSSRTCIFVLIKSQSIKLPVLAAYLCAVMVLVATATFTAGVLMLPRSKRVLHHSSQTPPPGTDHYEMVGEREKRAPLGAGVYKEVHKQDRQTSTLNIIGS